MMTDADIRRYAELMRELELSGFELSEGKKIRLGGGRRDACRQKVHVTEQDAGTGSDEEERT